jgi:hypothetical protein
MFLLVNWLTYREAVKCGKCVVIGLQSTGEARTLEQLERDDGELSDFVSTAKWVIEKPYIKIVKDDLSPVFCTNLWKEWEGLIKGAIYILMSIKLSGISVENCWSYQSHTWHTILHSLCPLLHITALEGFFEIMILLNMHTMKCSSSWKIATLIQCLAFYTRMCSWRPHIIQNFCNSRQVFL